MAQSPVVLIGGAAATLTQGRGALQDIDQMSLFEPVCKWTTSCRNAREIVPAMREAFRQAASGVPGPVFVELPLDVIYPLGEARAGMGLTVRDRAGRVLWEHSLGLFAHYNDPTVSAEGFTYLGYAAAFTD